MLTEYASVKNVKETLLSREQFHPFPKYEERQAWDALPREVREFYLSREEEILSFEIPTIPATLYMDFARKGAAPEFQRMAVQRRETLFFALVAECIEGKGKYVDKIIDLVWAFCEESSWIDPHHNNHMHNHMWSGVIKNALPDVTDYKFVDLIAASVAALLTWVYYFLKDRLDAESPLICKRIELEITKRIVIPFLHHDDLTWFGFYGHKINNWNPWILSDLMPAFMIVGKDPDLRAELIARSMEKLDIYINACNPDGGCDEGPGYWGAAGGTLNDCLEELCLFTNGELNFFHHPMVKNIGEYIVKANFCGRSFANFADNGPVIGTDIAMLYRFARNIASPRLKAFALEHAGKYDTAECYHKRFSRLFLNLFCTTEMMSAEKPEHIPQDDWLPDTQLFYVRDGKNQLTAAAKGGFNNESHNHNDLGHFICAYKGKQFLVDLGAPVYTAQAFSPFRYEIWIVQSAWHNCATLNGFDQHNGDEYRAQVLDCTMDDTAASLSMELKGAYEEKAGIESYVRTLSMDKENSVWTIIDEVKMTEPSEIESHFITVTEPKLCDGTVEIPVDDTHTALLTFDAEKMACTVDTHDLETDTRKKMWDSPMAYRIHLTAKEKTTYCVSTVTITVVEQ